MCMVCEAVWVGLVPRQSGDGIICLGTVTRAGDEIECRELREAVGTIVLRETIGSSGRGAEGEKT